MIDVKIKVEVNSLEYDEYQFILDEHKKMWILQDYCKYARETPRHKFRLKLIYDRIDSRENNIKRESIMIPEGVKRLVRKQVSEWAFEEDKI